MDNTLDTMTTSAPTLTVGGTAVGYYEPTTWFYPYSYPGPAVYYWPSPSVATQCGGEVHVFPCPHCDKCKCGGATKARKSK